MSYYLRYFLWLLAVIGLVIIVIILLLPGSNKGLSGKDFINYSSTNAVTSMIVDAPEGANSTHQAVRISVGQNQVTYQELSTYNYNVVKQQTFTNNQNAYEVFLRSLYFAGFLKGNTDPAQANPNGICPLGDRYIFNLVSNNQTIIHSWATSCSNSIYGGNTNLTVTLFENQVPNFSDLTENINF
ncbi:MAG TPA: hypothetical protein VFN31_01640 [Candidatus Saccharimonadales bacterium]|nr:hypothetical protein [Candidatus Saccharimonadales bacterium]